MPISKLDISFSNFKHVKLIPKKEFSLDANDILIYSVYLPDFIDLKSDLINFLNSKELDRVYRFYKEIDQDRFIIYRSVLKFVLAAYTQLDIKNLSFDYHYNKKPYLASHPWLYFNISHSNEFAVIAVSRKKVGIDIEFMSEDFEFSNFLLDIFNKDEILNIENAVSKKHAFYTSWTRKEAFAKALGKGIDEDFKNIPCLDGQHNIDSNLLKKVTHWQLNSFNFEHNYLIALAFEALPTDSKNIQLYNINNSMKELLEMIR